MSDDMSKRQYAKHRGVSRAAIAGALRDGRITAGPDGMIDPVRADADWLANTRPRVGNPPTTPPGMTPAGKSVTPPEPVKPRVELSDVAVAAYNESRARREAANAEMAELERDRLRGLLVDADQVRNDAFMAARAVRNTLQAIPARLSALLASEADEKKIYRMLEGAIDDACRALSEKAAAGNW